MENIIVKNRPQNINPNKLVRLLWHGTRANDPINIIHGENGLDMRYSNAGAHGNGIYFANNAAYSIQYQHTKPNGDHQFLLCLVIAGDTVQLPGG